MPASCAFTIIQDLYLLNRNFCSSDYDASLGFLNKLLPLKFYTFRKEDELNGWEIPPKWDFIEGTIAYLGKVIFKVEHPLQIIGLSKPFQGKVTLEELRKHLFYDRRDPKATPYHFRQNYRPWERDWGFCVSQEFYDNLPEGPFEVTIKTQEEEGYLTIGENRKEGKNPETFAFVAHLDHPGMANDDLAGVAVGIELFRRLQNIPTKFSYSLVLVQEIIGSVFYLEKMQKTGHKILESCFLEMLGTKTPLAFQKSRKEDTQLENSLQDALKPYTHRVGPFRSIICNDEIVWESYGIPMASLSRYPYPEYHSEKDNPSIISEEFLEESVQVLLKSIQELEKKTLLRKKFKGVLSLSNPQYNLYVDPGQPAFGSVAGESIQKLRLLMDLLPMYPSPIFVEKIASDLSLSMEEVLKYLKLWQDKGLVELI